MSVTVVFCRRLLKRATAPIFHTTATTISRMPIMAPEAPCGRKPNPATSRRTGPIQQKPDSVRTPAMASNPGTTATPRRNKRFMVASTTVPDDSTPAWRCPSIRGHSNWPKAFWMAFAFAYEAYPHPTRQGL
jgi:hypothetical protein